jgi:hypothetical protein
VDIREKIDVLLTLFSPRTRDTNWRAMLDWRMGCFGVERKIATGVEIKIE